MPWSESLSGQLQEHLALIGSFQQAQKCRPRCQMHRATPIGQASQHSMTPPPRYLAWRCRAPRPILVLRYLLEYTQYKYADISPRSRRD